MCKDEEQITLHAASTTNVSCEYDHHFLKASSSYSSGDANVKKIDSDAACTTQNCNRPFQFVCFDSINADKLTQKMHPIHLYWYIYGLLFLMKGFL